MTSYRELPSETGRLCAATSTSNRPVTEDDSRPSFNEQPSLLLPMRNMRSYTPAILHTSFTRSIYKLCHTRQPFNHTTTYHTPFRPHPTREALARQVEAGPQAVAVAKGVGPRQEANTKAVDAHGMSRAELFAAWPRILHPAARAITVEDAASAAMSLLDIEIRDGLVAWLSPGTLNINELSPEVQELFCGLEKGRGEEHCDWASAEAQNRCQDALIHLSAMLPDQLAATALSVLASFTWWRGNGALARVALDRALRCDPYYRLARLLERMVELAIRPVAK